MNGFERELAAHGGRGLTASGVRTVQVNVGLKCNLACAHCHLEAGDTREEEMSWETMEEVLAATEHLGPVDFDLTGGSPELNPHLPRLVEALVARGNPVRVRTNLVALALPEQRALPGLFRRLGVTLTASLPCYLDENVASQRGHGVLEGSIEALRNLNFLGYGLPGGPTLELVYNPGGPYLPPPQEALEAAYRKELSQRYGVSFTRLIVITNMPLGRFRSTIAKAGLLDAYSQTLARAFNPATLPGLMCRTQINVGWNGSISDCDFNRALGLATGFGAPATLTELKVKSASGRRIVTGEHCFACTAGQGSSCHGALSSETDSPAGESRTVA